jgi:hypothetical protein
MEFTITEFPHIGSHKCHSRPPYRSVILVERTLVLYVGRLIGVQNTYQEGQADCTLIRDLYNHYITQVTALLRHIIVFCLLFSSVCPIGLHRLAHSDTGSQSSIKAEQNHDLNQKAIAEHSDNQKRDTLRRYHADPISMRFYRSHIPLLGVLTPVKPDGQTANHPSPRPIHQTVSLYLI